MVLVLHQCEPAGRRGPLQLHDAVVRLQLHDDLGGQMTTTTKLPGIELAREVLGLDYGEIASAVQADESTLYRWRQGGSPSAVYLNRLERLDDLAREIQRTMRRERIPDWMTRPIPALGNASA